MITQSGAFGSAALDYLTGRQMGVSKFLSFGNKCDVTEVEILNYLQHDDETDVVLTYVEDIRYGREFVKVAKEVTTKKPIVMIKSGKSQAGARAASSHTGAIAGSDKIYSAAFEQTGVIRAHDMDEFFNAGKALAMQPPLLAETSVSSHAGGPGVMTVDELEIQGLTVEPFSKETEEKFEQLKNEGKILKIAATHNPVDLTGSVVDDQFVAAAELMFADKEIDGVIFLGLHHMPGLKETYIDGVAEIAKKYSKPMVVCDIGETEMALMTRSRFDRLGFPAYGSPEDAARAMKALVAYGEYLQRNGAADAYIKNFMKKRASKPSQ
jgi:acyl-CoA synthetase (NDP forming)